jgi:hypothetical protein
MTTRIALNDTIILKLKKMSVSYNVSGQCKYSITSLFPACNTKVYRQVQLKNLLNPR